MSLVGGQAGLTGTGLEEDDNDNTRYMLDDLQLAAELGKTLLERNKELETALKQHQNIIEDQAQEIEYLTKQTVALREVNDSRLRIYEQLEVSIQDLERANHRLALDHTQDKKQIKSLSGNIETLEIKCEDLQKNVDELTRQLDLQKRRAEKQNEQQERLQRIQAPAQSEARLAPSGTGQAESLPAVLKAKDVTKDVCQEMESVREEELMRMNKELCDQRAVQVKEQRRITELEEQLAIMVQENNRLQEKIAVWNQNDDAMKSMQEEFSILEEVRQGQWCGRCLRGVEQGTDDMSSVMDDDDRSALSSLANEPRSLPPHKLVHVQGQPDRSTVQTWATPQGPIDNPYRDLVEKYEALLEVQRHQANSLRKKPTNQNTSITSPTSAPLSLQEELQMSGDFSQFSIKDTDEESGHGDDGAKSATNNKGNKAGMKNRKNFIRTPDFSEAETSSSGFSDETSNKATQTDKERPGSFLCTIADGEDCQFSIYDDGTTAVDSRFRNRPEYRELFKEIFTILKKAAENKDDGEKLPLLDDTVTLVGKAPHISTINEDLQGDFTDDTQSVMSSVMSEQSIAFSDITPPEKVKTEKENIPQTSKDVHKPQIKKDIEEVRIEAPSEPQRVLTPLIRQPLEYMAASPQFRKKSSRHKNRKHSQDRQGAESPVIPSPPKISYQRGGGGSKRRRDYKPLDTSPLVKAPQVSTSEWNGSTMQFFNRGVNSPTPSQNGGKVTEYQRWNPETDCWEHKQSTASQDLHKLRRLELSYAEVLRNADKNKGRRRRHQ